MGAAVPSAVEKVHAMETDIYYLIRKRYLSLRPSERKVANILLDSGSDVSAMTIEWLAQAAQVSQPTVIRFAKAMGLEGFRQLKTALLTAPSAQETRPGDLLSFATSPQDKLADIPAKVISTNIQHLKDTLKHLSTHALTQAVQAIAQAESVFLIAAENSCAVAEDLATKLVYLGVKTTFHIDPYRQSVGAAKLDCRDVALAISYTGRSRSSIDALSAAKLAGARTVVITNTDSSPINCCADIVLSTGNQQYFYGGAIFSRSTQLAVVDMLYTGLLVEDYLRFTHHLEESATVSRVFNLER